MPRILRRLVNRIRYRRFQDEIAEELAVHRELKAQELRERADSPEAADSSAGITRAMGNELRMRELARAVWLPPSLDALRQDVRDALRMIVRRPLFTVMSLAALVVGVGAATIAFVLLNTLVLRPLPVDRPHELVYLAAPSFSYPIIREVRTRATFFKNAFAWNLEQYDVMWGNEPEPTLVLQASGSMYETLGVRPYLGRLLTPSDEGTSAADAQAVGVLSYGAWQRRFGADQNIIGRVMRLQSLPITIVGVSPPRFFGVAPGRAPEITVPVTLTPRLQPDDGDVLEQRTRAWLHFMGRLESGARREQVEPQFQVIWSQVLEATTSLTETPARRAQYLARRTSLMPGATGFSSVRNQFREPLMIVAGLAVLLLLVGCATVANMLLAGAWGRSRELAVRLALGCSRLRLARQLLIEGVLLATIASATAVMLSQWAGEALVALLTTTIEPVSLELAVDWRVGIFAVAVVGFTAILFSAAPVLVAVRVQPGPALKAGSHQVASDGGWIARSLVIIQVAVSVVLLLGAALFLRSLGHLLTLDPGFESERLLIARIDPVQAREAWPAEDRNRAAWTDRLYRSTLEGLRRTPGVVAASFSLKPTLSDEDGLWTRSVGIDGAEPTEGDGATFFNAVSPGYFETLRTPFVAGRDFAWSDSQGAERVAIVNEAFASRFFAGQDPLGRRITVGRAATRRNMTIVGVVADVKYQRLQETTRDIAYLPYLQAVDLANAEALFATTRVATMSERVTSDIRDAIVAAEPRLTPRVERLDDRIRESLVTERLLAMLAIALAACALFLACAGLFGLMMHLVSRRAMEIGIRMALGASAQKVLREVLGHTLLLTLVGTICGVTIASSVSQWIRGLLHGISPTDSVAFVSVALVTSVVAFCAGLIPARRAASTDPTTALRAE